MPRIPTWCRATILAATILGGIQGMMLSVPLLFSQDVQGIGAYVLILLILIAYAYVTVAGVIFWRYPNQLRPLSFALAMQVPCFSAPGLVYKFAVGLVVSVSFVVNHVAGKYSAGFSTSWNLGSSYELRFLQNARVELGINVIAVAGFLLLRKARSSRAVHAPFLGDGDQRAVTPLAKH